MTNIKQYIHGNGGGITHRYTDVTMDGLGEWGIKSTFYYKYQPTLVKGGTYSSVGYFALRSRVIGTLLEEFKKRQGGSYLAHVPSLCGASLTHVPAFSAVILETTLEA